MRSVVSQNITVTGTNGAATGTVKVGLSDVARLYAVQPIYDAGAPATTVFTVTSGGRTVATVPASNTAKQYPVVEQLYFTDGTQVAAGQSPRFGSPVVNGTATIAVTLANAGTYSIILYLLDD